MVIDVNRVLWDIETTGLNPKYLGYISNNYMKQKPRITCVSLKLDEVFVQFAGNNEQEIIEQFMNIIRRLRRFSRIFTYNGISFDMPYLIGRIEDLFEKHQKEKYYGFLRRLVWRDLIKISSLESGSLFIGKIMSAKEVAKYYGILYSVSYTGIDMLKFAFYENYEKIKEHGKGDIELLDMIIQRMCEEKDVDWRLL